jgi:hypothetical protein
LKVVPLSGSCVANASFGSRLCENAKRQREREIFFQPSVESVPGRQQTSQRGNSFGLFFSASLETVSFHTAWVKL